MRKLLFVLLVSFAVVACSNDAKLLKQNISGADSVAINYFKGDGTMDTVAAVKIIRDAKSISELASLITSNDVSVKQKCGYDGSIHFFRNDSVIQDIFFTSKEGCRQFLFRLNGKDAATEMDDKAKFFLSALQGK
jgi:hypothetical protein